MKSGRTDRAYNAAFSLVELMVVLLVAGILTAGLYSFLGQQRKESATIRLRADLESMAQITFFIIGRDIRRAGSNPKGWGAYAPGQPIMFEQASSDRLIIRADLNGDGVVEHDTDERIIYEYIDDPTNPDGVPDQIRRQAGDQLLIENVHAFGFCYWMKGGYWAEDCNVPAGNEPLIDKVRMRMVVGTGRVNPRTGQEDTKEIMTMIRPRNFDL